MEYLVTALFIAAGFVIWRILKAEEAQYGGDGVKSEPRDNDVV